MRYFFFSNDGKLGDAVLHTALIDGIHQYDQDAHISVAASLQTVEFWKRDPRIEDVITLHKAWFWDYIAAGIQHRDIDWLIFFKKRRSEKDWLFQLFSRAKNVIVSPMVPNAHAKNNCRAGADERDDDSVFGQEAGQFDSSVGLSGAGVYKGPRIPRFQPCAACLAAVYVRWVSSTASR